MEMSLSMSLLKLLMEHGRMQRKISNTNPMKKGRPFILRAQQVRASRMIPGPMKNSSQQLIQLPRREGSQGFRKQAPLWGFGVKLRIRLE